MSLDVQTRVVARDEFGHFIAAKNRAITASVEEAVQEGAKSAAALASRKTGAMAGSIEPVMLSATSGAVAVGTDHWRHQEYGTRPHPITGNVLFWWQKRGRYFTPGYNTINHPGNPGVHFMRAGYRVAKRELMHALKRNMS